MEDIHKMEQERIHFDLGDSKAFLAHVKTQIQEAQKEDPKLTKIIDEVKNVKGASFIINNEGILRFSERLCVLNIGDLRKIIIEEAHNSKYSEHPGATKMYQDLK